MQKKLHEQLEAPDLKPEFRGCARFGAAPGEDQVITKVESSANKRACQRCRRNCTAA